MTGEVKISEAAEQAMERKLLVVSDEAHAAAEVAVRTVAPFIDRAARIDELRREIELNERRADQVELDDLGVGRALRVLYLCEADRFRERIAELDKEGQ